MRLAFVDERAELTFDGRTLVFPRLVREVATGLVGLTTSGAAARFANLARLRRRTDAANTVFATVTIRASRARLLPVALGFSDRVLVYLNGRPLFRGADGWRSRDYRFLGTMGLFDEVVLPLEPGQNEIRLAVSEDFGGWGVTLQIPTEADVEVQPSPGARRLESRRPLPTFREPAPPSP